MVKYLNRELFNPIHNLGYTEGVWSKRENPAPSLICFIQLLKALPLLESTRSIRITPHPLLGLRRARKPRGNRYPTTEPAITHGQQKSKHTGRRKAQELCLPLWSKTFFNQIFHYLKNWPRIERTATPVLRDVNGQATYRVPAEVARWSHKLQRRLPTAALTPHLSSNNAKDGTPEEGFGLPAHYFLSHTIQQSV